MTLLLKEEDRRAVDLILDSELSLSSTVSGVANRVQLSSDPALSERIEGTQKLLKLLDVMPDVEVPADLLSRTLQLVDQAGTQNAAMQNIAAMPMARPSL